MKKIFTLLSVLVLSGLNSQTLTQSGHEPVAGDVENIRRLDTSAYSTGLPLNISGAGSVWNFSLAVPANNNTMTNTYSAPSTYTHGGLYPGATVVQNLDSRMYNYYQSGSSPAQAEMLGIYMPTLSLTFTNTALVIQYPASFGLNINDPVSGTFTTALGSGQFNGTSTTMADGTGTVVLPDGFTFTDVIRIRTEQNLTLSLGMFSGTLRQVVYNFYSESMKFPVINVSYVTVSVAGSPTVMAGMYRNAASFNTTGIAANTLSDTDVRVFPNPACNILSVEAGKAVKGQISVYDLDGSLVLRSENGLTGKKDLDVSGLAAGMYVLKIETAEQHIQKKFVVVK